MQDKILSLLVEQNDIGWKSIIYDLVKQEGMNPWDVDVSALADAYILHVKQLKYDLKVSGKVILAAAILLKIKSKRLISDDINEFDRLIATDSTEQFYDELEQQLTTGERQAIMQNIELNPRTPPPRPRKVSVYDLVKALEKALEVKKRRLLNTIIPPELNKPARHFDLGESTHALHQQILNYYATNNTRLTFAHILQPCHTKTDKIFTFIPLLHLSHQQKIQLTQEQHFGDIHISLPEEQPHAE